MALHLVVVLSVSKTLKVLPKVNRSGFELNVVLLCTLRGMLDFEEQVHF